MVRVRRTGNQLEIVEGGRQAETGRVRQRILFTLCSKAEALAVLGRPDQTSMGLFRYLLEREYPHITFNWKAIRGAIERNLDALPDLYEYRPERLRKRFRENLVAFTRSLVLANAVDINSAARLIEEHRHELEYLAGLIGSRLKVRGLPESEFNADNAFYWRFSLPGAEPPPDTEEHVAAFYERREFARAEAIFRLFTECFEGYAEGYNYLGLIALEQDRLDEAIAHFNKTIELGRKLFPARISKKHYWTDLSTRPYMRGLRNLALTLNQAGRFDQALAICDRLTEECGDKESADWYRATVSLNTGKWQQALDLVRRSMHDDAGAGFIAAFTLFDLGRTEEALSAFLFAALNCPRAAAMLTNYPARRPPSPQSYSEIEDHNTGISLFRSLHTYLRHRSPASRRFFSNLMSDKRVIDLLDQSAAAAARHYQRQQDTAAAHEAFARMQQMHSPGFAQSEARKLRDLAAPNGLATPPSSPGQTSRRSPKIH